MCPNFNLTQKIMGCFNVMGFHSHLPIVYGNDIVLLLGVKSNYEKKKVRHDIVTFAPGGEFTPIALPIFGTYDDYGSITNIIKDKNTEIIEKFFGLDIDKIIGLTDDYMHGRFCSDKDTELYDDMCKKIYDLQDEYYKKSEFAQVYEISFTIDHRFVYDTIKDLGASCYDFEKSYDALMELHLPWEGLDPDYFKQDEYRNKYENGEISEYEYMLNKWRNHSFNPYTGWFDYLNQGKGWGAKDQLTNIHVKTAYPRDNFWGRIDMMDDFSAMGVYKVTEHIKTLFTELKSEYIDFLKFVDEFRIHQWCFTYHVYGTQQTHCTTALPYYEKLLEHCKKVYEQEEEIRKENEEWEDE